MYLKGLNFFRWNSFEFDDDYFEIYIIIDIEDGMLYVIGCDWKLDSEIVIVD